MLIVIPVCYLLICVADGSSSTDSSPTFDTRTAHNYILNIPASPNSGQLSPNFDGRQERQTDYPYRIPPFTWDFVNQVQALTGAVLNAIAAQFNKDLGVIGARQDEVIKAIERACSKGPSCKKVPKMNDNLLRSAGFFSEPEEVVTNEKVEDVVKTLRMAMDEVDLRQNNLYDYVNCACDVNSLRPVLNVMFGNQPGDPTFRPDKATSLLSALITQLSPYNFSNWLGYNLNPLNSVFGGLFGFPFNIFPPSYTPPNYWGVFKPQGSQGGVYNSFSSYSGPSSTYASTYGYSSGTGSTYNSATSTSGPQGTSVTTNGRPGENYVVQHPGGGSTQVSTSGDGSSIAMTSTSGRGAEDPKNVPQEMPESVKNI